MKTAYKRLNRDHRIEIEKLIALGKNKKQIASTLLVHPSTITREIKRVKKGDYDNLKAEVNYVHKSEALEMSALQGSGPARGF